MDLASLLVGSGGPEELAGAFATDVLGWEDASVTAGDQPCSFLATSPSHDRPVELHLTSAAGPDARLASASSFDSGDGEPGLSVSFRGSMVEIGSAASCPTCALATVHVPYAGGVATTEASLPVEVRLELPAGATDRGVIILLRTASGAVEAVIATSIPDGDFAAG